MSVINKYRFMHCRCMIVSEKYYINQKENSYRAVQFNVSILNKYDYNYVQTMYLFKKK